MIELTIPGRGEIHLQHLVTDVNGTLALDGTLLEGVARRLSGLRDRLTLHLINAALGICVLSAEGAASETLLAADLVTPDIQSALDLLDKPLQIIASLRQ